MASHHYRHERPAMRSMRSAKAASGAAIAGTTTALSQDRRPKGPGMALSRQSLAVGTIGPVKPEPRNSRHRKALAALEP